MISAYFNITDIYTSSLAGYLYLIPVSGPSAYQNGIVWKSASDPFPNGTTQSIVPNTYDVVFGSYGKMFPDFTIYLPSNIDGQTVNAKDYIVSGSLPTTNFTASYAITSTFAQTASYALNISPADSASYALFAVSSSTTTIAKTASFATTATTATSASTSATALTASNIISNTSILISGSKVGVGTTNPQNALDVIGNISCSVVTASVGIFTSDIAVGGVTNPSHQIDVNSGSSIGCSPDNSFYIGTSGAQTYFVKNGGNVGIGKVAGSNRLEVVGNISASAVTASLYGTASFASNSSIQLPDITDNIAAHRIGINQTNPQCELDLSGSIGNSNRNDYFIGCSAKNSFLNNNGGMVAIGYNFPSYTLDVFGDISCRGKMGNISSGDYVFSSDGDSSWINANGGNVGIGTNGPAALLHVEPQPGITDFLLLKYAGASANSMRVYSPAGDWGFGVGTMVYEMPDSNHYLSITATQPWQWYSSDPFYFDSAGAIALNANLGVGHHVGIGTTNPNYTLDVSGDINFTGTLYKNGSTYVPTNANTASVALTSSFGAGIPHIQAGRVALTSATGSKVTFNKAFPNTNYIVTLNSSGSSSMTGSYISGPLTTTGFTASFVSFTGTLMWQAVSIT